MSDANRPRGGIPRGRRVEAEDEALTVEYTPTGTPDGCEVDPRQLPFVPNFPPAPRTFSAVSRFLEDREAVLGRGGKRWLAGRLLRAVDGDQRAAVDLVVAEARSQ